MPWASAGWITVRTWSSRAAANSSVSASGPSSLPMPDSTRCRMTSAPGEPPGSRVTMARSFATLRLRASFWIWVDFPDPSPPSNVMKRPRPDGRWTSCSVISELLGAGAEHSDHELAGTVDRATHGRAGGDRGPDRAAIDHARDKLLVDVFRHHHLDRLRAGKPDRATVAAKHFCVPDRL